MTDQTERSEASRRLAGKSRRQEPDHRRYHFSRDTRSVRANRLQEITDSVSLRRRKYIRLSEETIPLSSATTRVTVGIVSANIRSKHAQKCLSLVKQNTSNYDLVILDNNRSRDFNHSREMNRIISMARTDYIVLMDDDVHVTQGWLDGMLKCMSPATGVVTPIHMDGKGDLSYAGIVMCPDYTGQHTHILVRPEAPVPTPTICSAVILIDLDKCGHLRFDETYRKYFLDIDYGLRVWEAGFQCVCSPYSNVTHLSGATLKWGSAQSLSDREEQRQLYVRIWIESGRYRALENGIWQTVPEIKRILDFAPEVEDLLRRGPDENLETFHERATESIKRFSPYPTIQNYLWSKVEEAVGEGRPTRDDPERAHLGILAELRPRLNLLQRLRRIIVTMIRLGPRGTTAAALFKFLGKERYDLAQYAYRDWRSGERSFFELFNAGVRGMWRWAKLRLRRLRLSEYATVQDGPNQGLTGGCKTPSGLSRK